MGYRDGQTPYHRIIADPNGSLNRGLTQRSGHMRADPIALMRQLAEEYRSGPQQISTTAAFTGIATVIRSYSAQDERLPHNTQTEFRRQPYVIAHVPRLDVMHVNPNDTNSDLTELDLMIAQYLAANNTRIFYRQDSDPNGYLPEEGETIRVFMNNIADPHGTYTSAGDPAVLNPSRVNRTITSPAPDCPSDTVRIISSSDAEPAEPLTPAPPLPDDLEENALWLARMINIEAPGGSQFEQLAIMKIAINRMFMAIESTRYRGQTSIREVVWSDSNGDGDRDGSPWFGGRGRDDVGTRRVDDQVLALARSALQGVENGNTSITLDPGDAGSPGIRITPGYHHMVHPRQFLHVWEDEECSADRLGEPHPGRRGWICADTEYPSIEGGMYRPVSARGYTREEMQYLWMPSWTVSRLRPGGQASNEPFYAGRALLS